MWTFGEEVTMDDVYAGIEDEGKLKMVDVYASRPSDSYAFGVDLLPGKDREVLESYWDNLGSGGGSLAGRLHTAQAKNIYTPLRERLRQNATYGYYERQFAAGKCNSELAEGCRV